MVDFMDNAKEAQQSTEENITLQSVYEIPVQISIVLGKAVMPVTQLLKLGKGSVIELDRKVGDPVDVFVNGRIVAKGEVVIVNDKIGVTLTEIIRNEKE